MSGIIIYKQKTEGGHAKHCFLHLKHSCLTSYLTKALMSSELFMQILHWEIFLFSDSCFFLLTSC